MATKILAHRGAAAYAPENTMSAFNLAWQMGADGLEIDVHLTKDKALVVTHDENTKRVTGQDYFIKDLTLAQLLEFNFANKFTAEKFYPIPTLDEVLEFVKDKNLILNIELKNSVFVYPNLEEMALEAVNKFNLAKQVIFSSFNHYSLVKLKKLSSTAKCGLLYEARLYEPWNYCQRLGLDALHPHFSNLSQTDLVPQAHANGLTINTWTVDEPQYIKQIIDLGTDSIITNKPDIAVNIRQK